MTLIAKVCATAAALGPASSFATAPVSAASLDCVNPSMSVALHQRPGNTKLFETDWVQFNVNTPAAPGTLFVDGNNHAVCVVKTPRLALRGAWEFDHQATKNAGAVRIRFDHVPPSRRRFMIMQGSTDQTIVVARFKVWVR